MHGPPTPLRKMRDLGARVCVQAEGQGYTEQVTGAGVPQGSPRAGKRQQKSGREPPLSSSDGIRISDSLQIVTKLPLPENPPLFNGVRGVLHTYTPSMANLTAQPPGKAAGPEAVGNERLTVGISSAASGMLRVPGSHIPIASLARYPSLKCRSPREPPGPTDYVEAFRLSTDVSAPRPAPARQPLCHTV